MQKKIFILQSGNAGSGKDYVARELSNKLEKEEGKKVYTFAHADIIKEYVAKLHNIDVNLFSSSKKDDLYIVLDQISQSKFSKFCILTDKNGENERDYTSKIYTKDELSHKSQIINAYQLNEIYNYVADIYLDFNEFVSFEDYVRANYKNKILVISLRELLLYYGVYVFKLRMPQNTFLYEEFRKLFLDEKFVESDVVIITDNRFMTEYSFFFKELIPYMEQVFDCVEDVYLLNVFSNKDYGLHNEAEGLIDLEEVSTKYAIREKIIDFYNIREDTKVFTKEMNSVLRKMNFKKEED